MFEPATSETGAVRRGKLYCFDLFPNALGTACVLPNASKCRYQVCRVRIGSCQMSVAAEEP